MSSETTHKRRLWETKIAAYIRQAKIKYSCKYFFGVKYRTAPDEKPSAVLFLNVLETNDLPRYLNFVIREHMDFLNQGIHHVLWRDGFAYDCSGMVGGFHHCVAVDFRLLQ